MLRLLQLMSEGLEEGRGVGIPVGRGRKEKERKKRGKRKKRKKKESGREVLEPPGGVGGWIYTPCLVVGDSIIPGDNFVTEAVETCCIPVN